ncbi:hypothetical protein UFOVP406_39 [uncultured Caudovirales phage]|uniref:Uncharacterized protein n=1 Tax=uncultured Caudovirales phage TaxID=2100421 RepID=A0A6J5M2Z5_9CAUD|nr:hypothetical protein UFOVP406_39 [uncultured Caudovirales phage]
MNNAIRHNTFYTFAGLTRDDIRAARAAHIAYARKSPTRAIAARYVFNARLCTWELLRRAATTA